MLLTFAANAVDLPDRLLSRSFADTVDLSPLTAAVDLLIRPGPCDCSSTPSTFCCRGLADVSLSPQTCRLLVDAIKTNIYIYVYKLR